MMRKGDSVVVISGPWRGMGGRIRKRAKDGRLIVNLNACRGISTCAYVRPGELRPLTASEIQRTQNATAGATK